MTFDELIVLQGVLAGLFDVFTLFDGPGTNGRRYRGGSRHWGRKGGRWWPRPVDSCLWRSWEEIAMTICELFVFQGVLAGLFDVSYTF